MIGEADSHYAGSMTFIQSILSIYVFSNSSARGPAQQGAELMVRISLEVSSMRWLVILIWARRPLDLCSYSSIILKFLVGICHTIDLHSLALSRLFWGLLKWRSRRLCGDSFQVPSILLPYNAQLLLDHSGVREFVNFLIQTELRLFLFCQFQTVNRRFVFSFYQTVDRQIFPSFTFGG